MRDSRREVRVLLSHTTKSLMGFVDTATVEVMETRNHRGASYTLPRADIWSLYRTAGERFGTGPVTSTPKKTSSGNRLNLSLLSIRHEESQQEKNKKMRNPQKDENSLPLDLVSLWTRRYECLKEENEDLRLTIRLQAKTIRDLTNKLKDLNSEIDSSESRDKSTSHSTPPVGLVTPQKRTKKVSTNQQQTTDSAIVRPASDSGSRSRRILREAGIDSDILASSNSENAVVTPGRSRAHTQSSSLENEDDAERTLSHTRDQSSYRDSTRRPQSAPREDRNRSVLRTPVIRNGGAARDATFVMSSNREGRNRLVESATISSSASDKTPTVNRTRVINDEERIKNKDELTICRWSNSTAPGPGYFLRMRRPDFIYRLERRQAAIRAAAANRHKMELLRKDAARSLILGKTTQSQVRDVLFVDATRVRAFPEQEMKAITKRRMSRTREVRNVVKNQQNRLDQAANRIIAHCFDQRTRQRVIVEGRLRVDDRY